MKKIGIIGVGYAGELHAKALEEIFPDVLYYVYDVSMQASKNFAKTHNCQAIKTLEGFYNNVDAVIIATPTFTHYKLAMEAMQKGKHVLCEKPIAIKVEEAAEMSAMAKEKKLICTIGFNYRFFEITKILKKQIQIGKYCSINLKIKRLFRNEWHNKENGVLTDLGIHLIDYLIYLCGQDINLSTCNIKQKYINDWDYDSNITGKTEGGIFFELTASRTQIPQEVQFSIEIIGTAGIFKYDSRKETSYVIEQDNTSHIYNFKKEKETNGFFDFFDSILRQDILWVEWLSGYNRNQVATFEDGYRAQKVLDFLLSKNTNRKDSAE